MRQKKRTKIVCTIGPSSNDGQILSQMIGAGMNVARLNFSHGSHDDHAKLIALVREVAEEVGEPVAILQDLQGPKIRVVELPAEGVKLEVGELVVFSTADEVVLPKIGLTYKKLHEDVKAGDRLLLDDGLLEVRVKEVRGRDIECEVVTGGVLTSHKGLNLPTATLNIPAITEKDREDLEFGVAQGVDWVALSFVREAREIQELRELIAGFEKKQSTAPIKIIAKIEMHEAIKNIDQIIDAADGIMVARGDLGIEVPAEEVPLLQKTIIEKCRDKSKPVIVATQMLDSMIRNPRPTRAEVSDVANAVIDHADAVMLSGESASGKYPVEAVTTMTRIIMETEKSRFDDVAIDERFLKKDTERAVSEVAGLLARDVVAKLILVMSSASSLGQLVSRYRPEMPIVVMVDDNRRQRQLNLSWGVMPIVVGRSGEVSEMAIETGVGFLKKQKLVRSGNKIIVVGESKNATGSADLVEVRTV